MTGDPVIRAEGLGKKYLIGHQAERERYTALRDVVARNARNLVRSARDLLSGRAMVGGDEVEEFWALREIDFEIRRGEVVGVIGRNGAGKSTLLKVLSRITEPTAGRVEIRGRVASLLEVGTGFHPELSGRENIFLNGAILGMGRAETRRKFDEIVAFAEVERFLDTPVKRYSSGMYVRLAFAVAAHLEPEILVVDEVLAVGDAEFQRKCLGKMRDVAGHGRTVLFVSHQLGMITRLCDRGIVLSAGKILFDGAVDAAIDRYVGQGSGGTSSIGADVSLTHRPAAITGFKALDPRGQPMSEFSSKDPIRVQAPLALSAQFGQTTLGVAIENQHSVRVATWHARLADHLPPGATEGVLELEIPGGWLAPGPYSFVVALFETGVQVHQQFSGEWPFVIVDSGSEMSHHAGENFGVVVVPGRWSAPPQ